MTHPENWTVVTANDQPVSVIVLKCGRCHLLYRLYCQTGYSRRDQAGREGSGVTTKLLQTAIEMD